MTLRAWLVVVIVALWNSLAMAAPAVYLSPTVGPPTTKVTVTGGGFTAFAAIDVFFDTDDRCLALANGAGNFSCIFIVSADAQPQLHWVSAVQRSNQTGAQAPFQVRTDWTQFLGRTAAHTGRNPFENTITKANVADLDLLWSRPIGTGSWRSPVVYGNNVYVASKSGSLFAFNALTGAALAGFPKAIGNAAVPTPAIIAGNVFAVGSDGTTRLWGFNALTGAPAPGFPVALGAGVAGNIAASQGRVYLATAHADNKVHAFSATTGAPVAGFPVQLQAFPVSGPTVADGVVYITDSNLNLYVLDAATGGAVEGPYAAAGSAESEITVQSGGIYYPYNLEIRGYTGRDVSAIPGFPLSMGSSTRIAVGRGLLVAARGGSGISAFRFASPAGALWTTALDVSQTGSPIVAGELVFVNSLNRLYALAADTGAMLWSAAVKSTGSSSPVVANGIVYLADDRGRLFAFSVNGQAPTARLPGGAMGVRPALTDLKPDLSLAPVRN